MSVLIKGMEMPKNCYDCQLNKGCDARWFLEIDRRPDDCPLVDVPTPHGRLVDADNIYTSLDGYLEFTEKEAPTIIEAESEET